MKSAEEMARIARAMRDERENQEQTEANVQLEKLDRFLMEAVRRPAWTHLGVPMTVEEVAYTGPLNRLALHALREKGFSVKDAGEGWRIGWKAAAKHGATGEGEA